MTKQMTKRQAAALIQEALTAPLPGDDEFTAYYDVTLKGRPPEQVAAALNLTPAEFQTRMRRVARWVKRKALPVCTRNVVGTHLERLEQQWHMAMIAWHRSCEDEEVTKTTVERVAKVQKKGQASGTGDSGTGVSPVRVQGDRPEAGSTEAGSTEAGSTEAGSTDEKHKVERTTKRGAGDVRYLEQARKIMAEIRTLAAQAQHADEKLKQEQEELPDVETLTVEQRAQEAADIIIRTRLRAAGREGAG